VGAPWIGGLADTSTYQHARLTALKEGEVVSPLVRRDLAMDARDGAFFPESWSEAKSESEGRGGRGRGRGEGEGGRERRHHSSDVRQQHQTWGKGGKRKPTNTRRRGTGEGGCGTDQRDAHSGHDVTTIGF
jgi:hypothetical protein